MNDRESGVILRDWKANERIREDPQTGGNKQFVATRSVPTGQAFTSIELPAERSAEASACCSVSTYRHVRHDYSEIALI